MGDSRETVSYISPPPIWMILTSGFTGSVGYGRLAMEIAEWLERRVSHQAAPAKTHITNRTRLKAERLN
jgi:hypothetical protein